MKNRHALGLLAGVFACAAIAPAMGGSLIYTPINPSFGGNPLNSSHLLSLASSQRSATASDANTSSAGDSSTGSTTGTTAAELFVSQLQGRLLSALASQVTEAIFGDNPQDSGTVQFGDTTVSFDRSLDSITLTIDDSTGSTTIVVPLLVVN